MYEYIYNVKTNLGNSFEGEVLCDTFSEVATLCEDISLVVCRHRPSQLT